MPRLVVISLALLFVAPALRAAGPPPAIRTALDIRYHPGKDRQLLDVFAPPHSGKADPSRRYPVVFFIHGGTWIAGDKNQGGRIRAVGQSLARQGFVAVLINYRLSPSVRHPEHVKDVARAFAWVRKHIAEHGGDPDRIIVAGHSAGGHLATLLVTDECYLNDPALGLDARARKSIRAVVSLCGVYRVPEEQEFRAMSYGIIDNLVGDEGDSGVKGRMKPALFALSKGINPFRMVFGNDPDVCKKASPITHVRKSLPPMLLLTPESEVPGLRAMSADFAKALRAKGNAVEEKEIDDTTHRTILYSLRDPHSDASKAVHAFITRHTAGKP